MGINKGWQTTLCFRKFRDKTHDLSRVYWTQQMSADCLRNELNTKKPNDISAKVIPCSFDSKMHNQTVADTLNWIDTYMERNRLHLLVIYTAFLETYLKEISFYHIASLGNVLNPHEKTTPIKLTRIGEATSSPIIKSSTVPEMIKYASELFDIDFGLNATEWIKIYKVRCAAAHNGGIATPKFLQDISGMPLALNPKEYENIGLTWDELRLAMKYGDNIAAMIDSKVSTYQIKLLEVEQILREFAAKRKLPKHTLLWTHMHENYGFSAPKRVEKNELFKKYYPSWNG